MDVIVLFFVFSLLWVVGFPIIAYPYYKELKKEYGCPNGLLAFAIITGLLIFATPFVAYAIFIMVWFNRIGAAIPLLFYPICIAVGLFLFHKSFTEGRVAKSIWYLAAVWFAILLIALLFVFILH